MAASQDHITTSTPDGRDPDRRGSDLPGLGPGADHVHVSFDGEPDRLDVVIGVMFELKLPRQVLVS